MVENQGTDLANWRKHPFSVWGFQNVDKLIDTQKIERADQPNSFASGTPLDLADVNLGAETAVDLLARSFTDGFMVLKDGAVVSEIHTTLGSPEARHVAFSVTKSFTGALTGVFVGRGQVDVDAPVTTYLPEVQSSAYGDCTVRHLLDMTATVAFFEEYEDRNGDVARYRIASGWDPDGTVAAPDGIHSLITTMPRGEGRHGERFQYVSPNTDLLGWVIERVSGATVARLFSRHIWQPMGGATDALMVVDRHGVARAAGGLFATLSDFARFGEVIRKGGFAGVTPVIPSDWVEDLFTGGSPEPWQRSGMTNLFPHARYRSHWYAPLDQPGTLYAIGIHGQWIYVDRESGVTAVKLSSQPLAVDEALDRSTVALFRAIVRHLG